MTSQALKNLQQQHQQSLNQILSSPISDNEKNLQELRELVLFI